MKNNELNDNKQKINYKKSFIYLWQYMKVYKNQFLFVVLSSLLISMMNAGVVIGQYYFMRFLTDVIKTKLNNEFRDLVLFSSLLFIAVFFIAILFVLQVKVMTKIAQFSGKQIRKDLYFKILELKLSYFDQNPSGDIMSLLTNDVNNVTNALTQNVTQFMINITQMIIMLISMFIFSPILATITIAFAPVQLIVILLFFKKAQPNFAKKQTKLGQLNGFVEETISGQKVINNFNKQETVIAMFQVKNMEIQKNDNQTQRLSSMVGPWNTFMQWMLIVAILIVATIFGSKNINFGGITSTLSSQKTDPAAVIALLSALMLFVRNYSNPIYQIFQMLYLLQGAIAGTERSFTIKKQPIEINFNETDTIKNIKGDIKFKNLTFSYDGKRNILKNIDLHINPGQVVGIVGPTGSGKTTIINLLTKFYDITNEDSDILIDGMSIKKITKESLRNEISIVLQDTFIFGESIYDNLRYAKPEATNEEIIQACKEANAHHFIMALENGYNSILKNNAEALSQGERQLLAIARAFLKNNSILILDEATSSIDTKTEKDIQTGMIKLSKGKTTFMIAHRLSTIKHADIIIVLKDGEILEQGNHQELLQRQGFYANMYNSKLNTPEDL